MLSQPKLIVTQPSLAGAGITIAGNTAIANGVHLNIKKDAPGLYHVIIGSFGLSTKEPYTIMNCLSCVVGIGVVVSVVCAHLPLAQG